MGKALYRKYRSKNLSEVVGQEHITTTLQNALKSGKISHAYLFTGPRGVGKTSVARILAHEINKLEYHLDGAEHLDIIEIDAASNRRIDEIRDLRDKVRIAPVSARYKVYIIDEAHMLTREAFNALLKTLEEPPEHAIFILATTEAHKLPDTITSRTQRFNFKAIEDDQAVIHLRNIATKEGITIDDGALALIAQYGNGSFRDSIGLLDQLQSAAKSIDKETVRGSIGMPETESVNALLNAIESTDRQAIIELLEKQQTSGIHAAIIAHQLSIALTSRVVSANFLVSPRVNIKLLKNLLNVPSSPDPYQLLEILLIEATLSISTPPALKVEEETPTERATKNRPTIEPTAKKPIKSTNTVGKDELWGAVLSDLKGSHNTLYGIVRMAVATFDDDKLTLAFAFEFHKRRCSESRNKDKLQEIIQKHTGKGVEIICIVDKSAPKVSLATQDEQISNTSDTLDSITQVFGGGEILEQ